MKKDDSKIFKIVGCYILQNKIGSGAFSKVYKGFDIANSRNVAIKVMKSKLVDKNPSIKNGILHEMQALNLTKECQNIIKFYDFLNTKNNYYFIYQLCESESLEDLINKQGFIHETKAKQYFKQILIGLKVLNSHKIIHRDIKPSNILFKNGKLKIADFGLCKILKQDFDIMESMVGTTKYQAPEITNGQNYSSKCDIYSLGILFYKMLYGYCPYESSDTIQMMYQQQLKGISFPSHIQVSHSIKQFLKRMLQKDELNRMSWQDIFNQFQGLYQQQYRNSVRPGQIGKQQSSVNQKQVGFLTNNCKKNQSICQTDVTETVNNESTQKFTKIKPIHPHLKKSSRIEFQLQIQQIIQMHKKILNNNEVIIEFLNNKLFGWAKNKRVVKKLFRISKNLYGSLLQKIQESEQFENLKQNNQEHFNEFKSVKNELKEQFQQFQEILRLANIHQFQEHSEQQKEQQKQFLSLITKVLSYKNAEKGLQIINSRMLILRIIDILEKRQFYCRQYYQQFSKIQIESMLYIYTI